GRRRVTAGGYIRAEPTRGRRPAWLGTWIGWLVPLPRRFSVRALLGRESIRPSIPVLNGYATPITVTPACSAAWPLRGEDSPRRCCRDRASRRLCANLPCEGPALLRIAGRACRWPGHSGGWHTRTLVRGTKA